MATQDEVLQNLIEQHGRYNPGMQIASGIAGDRSTYVWYTFEDGYKAKVQVEDSKGYETFNIVTESSPAPGENTSSSSDPFNPTSIIRAEDYEKGLAPQDRLFSIRYNGVDYKSEAEYLAAKQAVSNQAAQEQQRLDALAAEPSLEAAQHESMANAVGTSKISDDGGGMSGYAGVVSNATKSATDALGSAAAGVNQSANDNGSVWGNSSSFLGRTVSNAGEGTSAVASSSMVSPPSDITLGKPEYSQEKHSWVNPILKDGKPTGEVYEGGGLEEAQKLQGENAQDVYHDRFADKDTGLSAGDFLYNTQGAQDYLAAQQAEQARLAEATANAQRIAEEANKQAWVSDGQGNYVATGAPDLQPVQPGHAQQVWEAGQKRHEQEVAAWGEMGGKGDDPNAPLVWDASKGAFNRTPTAEEQAFLDAQQAAKQAEAEWYAGVQRAEAAAYDAQRIEDVTDAAGAGQWLNAEDSSLLAMQQGLYM